MKQESRGAERLYVKHWEYRSSLASLPTWIQYGIHFSEFTCRCSSGQTETAYCQTSAIQGNKLRKTFTAAAAAWLILSAQVLAQTQTAPLEFGQASGDFSTQPGDAGQAGPPLQSGNPNPSNTASPPSAYANVPVLNQNQALSVNPVTGLVTASALGYHSLSGNERWQLYWKQNYWSVGAYFGPVFTALVLDQATGSPSQWGGGVRGYGLRVASRTAMGAVQGTLQASIAAVLHEDVRYISSAPAGFKKRALHAIAFSFVTYNAQGRTTLNFANLTSIYATTAIATAWVPGRFKLATYTLTNGTEQIALSLPINLLQEFWPEIRRKIFRRSSP
jgi:hypothetical protein